MDTRDPRPLVSPPQSALAPWRPALGACVRPEGTLFRVWAPEASALELVIEGPVASRAVIPLEKTGGGYFELLTPAAPGTLYRYRVDGKGPFPDPASRFQPHGVHGSSQVIDPASYRWSDAHWAGQPLSALVLYEMHVGTFSARGTFAGAAEKLAQLAQLGVNAIELMPVADFPGSRGWGYDGAALFAPARCYGEPDELRAFVDLAHDLGLSVILDVVYNHFGPDGNYTGAFSPYYMTAAHRSPWGDGVNLDREQSAGARAFFVENALHWLAEYHMDGLRLDATHALVDESPRPFAAQLSDAVRSHFSPGPPRHLIAEDNRNLNVIVRPTGSGGWGMDAVWSDDFHHQMRRMLSGERDGYFADFEDRMEDLAELLRNGWLYSGQYAPYFKAPRGSDPAGIAPERFVFCLQNHDQVGNRAFGDRMDRGVDPAAFRAASALLLCAPQTPLLFMGQEWGASSPFLYFTDHAPELGRRVTEGRRREFASFAAFADPQAREAIPDPQARETFETSRLRWEEISAEPHRGLWRLHQALLRLRREELTASAESGFSVAALDADALALRRSGPKGSLLAICRLRGAGTSGLRPAGVLARSTARRWNLVLSTEAPAFCPDPRPARCVLDGPVPAVFFQRPGAVILRGAP